MMEYQNSQKALLVIKLLFVLINFSSCKTNTNSDIVKKCDAYDCEIGKYKNNKKDGIWEKIR